MSLSLGSFLVSKSVSSPCLFLCCLLSLSLTHTLFLSSLSSLFPLFSLSRLSFFFLSFLRICLAALLSSFPSWSELVTLSSQPQLGSRSVVLSAHPALPGPLTSRSLHNYSLSLGNQSLLLLHFPLIAPPGGNLCPLSFVCHLIIPSLRLLPCWGLSHGSRIGFSARALRRVRSECRCPRRWWGPRPPFLSRSRRDDLSRAWCGGC